MSGNPSITELLRRWADGDGEAREAVAAFVYGELRQLAGGYLRRERPGHTLSPTALVNEAFLRLSAGSPPGYEGRVQFIAVAARQMRRVLVDHARRRTAGKRGGRERPITFDEALHAVDRPEELVALDDALEALAAMDERKARVIDLRYFGGLGPEEIAASLGVHANTVARDLRFAEAWLKKHLTRGS